MQARAGASGAGREAGGGRAFYSSSSESHAMASGHAPNEPSRDADVGVGDEAAPPEVAPSLPAEMVPAVAVTVAEVH